MTDVIIDGRQVVGFFDLPKGIVAGLFQKENLGVLITITPKGDSSDVEIVF
jgi:hypothetical protein